MTDRTATGTGLKGITATYLGYDEDIQKVEYSKCQ